MSADAGPPNITAILDAVRRNSLEVVGTGFVMGMKQPVTVTDQAGNVLGATVVDLGNPPHLNGDFNVTMMLSRDVPSGERIVVSARYPQAPASDVAVDYVTDGS